MSRQSKVAWKDGMVLLPQHFQQAERAIEASLGIRLEALGFPGWGIVQLQFQEGALEQGRLEINRCVAILPDGTALSIPDIDAPPPVRSFELSADKAGLDVYLTLPLVRPRQPQVTVSAERADIRARELSEEVSDDYDPSRERSLKLLSRNLRLLVGDEPQDDLTSLKLGHITRLANGSLAFRTDVLPPLLRIGAHEGLHGRLRNLSARVTARARSLKATRAQRVGPDANAQLLDGSPHDLLSFMFAQTLLTHGAQLRQLVEQPASHPLVVYQHLVQLAGALSAFDAKSWHELPIYQHAQSGDCFAAAEKVIGELLNKLFLSRFESIELTRRENWWHGVIGDGELRTRGRFILGVSSTLAANDLIARFPTACKLADVDTLKTQVGLATGKPMVSWLNRIPSGLPTAQELTWFQISSEGPEFERVRAGAPLGIYVPTWLPIQRMELWGYLANQNG